MSRLTAAPSNHNDDPRAVNNMLHTLRGEQFRHSQNLQRSRAHISATLARARNSPTLPIDVTSPDYPTSRPLIKFTSSSSAYRPCSGPEAPRSWTLISKEVREEETPAWRARAVSLILPPVPVMPTMVNLCLRAIAELPTAEFTRDVVPHLPPHLRRDLIRHAAVCAPLSTAKIYALCEPEGHTDTELIVMGPSATLRDDYFIRLPPNSPGSTDNADTADSGKLGTKEEPSWDSDDDAWPDPLATFILVSTRLATSTFLSLPPTLTRLALINLPSPVPLHRLPGTCPLLIVLDLSYNTWLEAGSDNAERVLERVEWSRWNHLRVLGLRGCCVTSGMLVKLNRGRWDDVEVVQ